MKRFVKLLFIPLAKIDAALPRTGTIYDVGCGEGVIANYISRTSQRIIIGIDQDQARLKAGKLSSTSSNVTFVKSDIITHKYSRMNGCVISDVLHHLSKQSQRKLLQRISAAMKPGGVLVIKEINRSDMVLSKLSRLWDFVLYPKDTINYFSQAEIVSLLNSLNFKVVHKQVHRLVPASIHLYICTKA